MRKNKTYNKRLTKYREKEKNVTLGVFICLVIGAGIINAIVSGFKPELNNVSTSPLEAQIQAPMTLQATSSEYLSNGDRVIYTKTDYFENEVQVWLAAEQAAKHVGEGDAMIKDLMAMAWTESRSFNYKAMGDGNKSYGIYQIHLGYHPEVTIAQATDPYWAAEWTAERLIAKGWKRDREYAIRSHNGNPTQPQTLPYIQTVNQYLAKN